MAIGNDLFKLFDGPGDARSSSKLDNLESISSVESEQDSVTTRSGLISDIDLLVDYSDFANFVKFNSAYEYFAITAERIINEYPLAGTADDVSRFERESDGYQRYVLKNWPAQTGHLRIDSMSSSYVKFDDVGQVNGVTRTSLLSPGTGSFSIQFWYDAPPAAIGNASVVLQKTSPIDAGFLFNGYFVGFNESLVMMQVTSGSVSSYVSAPMGTGPQFVAFVCDRTSQTGSISVFTGSFSSFPVLVSTASLGFSSRLDLGSGSFYIGTSEDTINNFSPFGSNPASISGSIDDVSFWSVPRTLAQLTSSYNRKLYAQPGLIGGWRFNESQALPATSPQRSLIKDCSGHRLDGRVQNYYSTIRGSGSLAYDAPDPITVLEDPDVASYIVEQQASGTAYDRTNSSKIIDMLPAAFSRNDEDPAGAQLFRNFTFAVGRQFDLIKLYIDQFSNLMRVEHGDFDQAPDALLADVGKFFGWDQVSSFIDIDTLKYIVGLSVSSGSAANQQLSDGMPDIKSAFWRRTLLNLPYLYKTKGTRESVESLMRIYGLNKNHVRLKEHASQRKRQLEANRILSEKSSYALKLSSGTLSGSVSISYPISYTSLSATSVYDFSTPGGSGFDRPYTAAGLTASLGITGALATAIFSCDDGSPYTFVTDRISTQALTSSAVARAFTNASGSGLVNPSGMSLTTLPVVEVVSQNVNFFTSPNNNFLDFPSGSVAILAVIRNANAVDNSARGIIGKLNTTTARGYGIGIPNAGVPLLYCGDGGTGGNTSVIGSGHVITDGAWHYIAAIWDRTANQMRCISDVFPSISSSMAMITGSMSTDVDNSFRIGLTRTNEYSCGMQYAYVAIFSGSNAEVLNNKTALDMWWQNRVGVVPSGWIYSRPTVIGSLIGSGSDGDLLHVWGVDRFAHGWRNNLSGSGLGVLAVPAITNLFSFSDVTKTGGWSHSGSVTMSYGRDPRAVNNSLRVQKTGSENKITTAVQLISGTQYCFSIWTKSTSSIPFLRVMNDKIPGTVMYAETSRSDGQAVRADSGWHRIYMRYTPNSGSLYRFEALPSSHSSSVGDCEFQYAQLESGSFPSALAWSNQQGPAGVTSAKTILMRTLSASEKQGLGKRGGLAATAQFFTHAEASTRDLMAVGGSASLVSAHGYSVDITGKTISYAYNNASALVASATASALSDLSRATSHLIEWDSTGITGSTFQQLVRTSGNMATDTTSVAGISDPTSLYIGSRTSEDYQAQAVIRDVTLYGFSGSYASLDVDGYSVECRLRVPTTSSVLMTASLSTGSIWSMSGTSGRYSLRWERQLGSTTGSIIFALPNTALSMSSLPIFDDRWYNVSVVKEIATGSFTAAVRRVDSGEIAFLTSSVLNSASIARFSRGESLDSITVGTSGNIDSQHWINEFRIWSASLSPTELDDHCLNYQSYGRDTSFNNKDLLIHWRLNEGSTANSSGKIYHEDLSARGNTGTGSYAPSASPYTKFLEEYSYIAPPDGWTDDKISVFESEQVPRDMIPHPSRFVSLEMNVVDALNEDISQMMSSFDEMNNVIGAPNNKYGGTYEGLQQMRETYFKRLQGNLNFRIFVDMLDFFDRTFVTLIKRLLPARAIFLGDEAVIESHMLERPKYDYGLRPTRDDLVIIEGKISVVERD